MRLATGDTTPEDVQSVAAHEFGHALGIQGHSDNPNDLMFPSATRYFAAPDIRLPDPPHEVTRRDLNTLRACYPRLPVAAPPSP